MYSWVNKREAGDLRRHRAHHGVSVMNLMKVNIAKSEWVIIHGLKYFADAQMMLFKMVN